MLAMEGGGSYLTGVQPVNQSPRTSLFLRKLEQVNSLGGSEMEGALYFGVRPMDQTPRTIPMLRKLDQINPVEMSTRSHKKMKVDNEDKEYSSVPWFTDSQFESKYKTKKIPNVIDYSDPFSIPQLMEELNRSIYGCVAKDIQDLRARKIQSLHAKFASYPSIPSYLLDLSSDPSNFRLDTDLQNARSTKASQLDDKQSSQLASQKVLELDDDCIVVDPPVVVNSKSVSVSSTEKTQEPGRQSILPVTGVGHMKISDVQNNIKSDSNGVLIIDSDEEDNGTQTIQSVTIRSAAPEATPLVSCKYQEVVLKKPTDGNTVKELQITGLDANLQAFYKYQELFLKKPTCGNTIKEREDKNARESAQDEQKSVVVEKERKKEKGVYVGVQGDSASHNSNLQIKQEDGLEDMWREMALALEFSKPKDGTEDGPAVSSGGEEGDECDHSFVLKDDLGYVCRVCGVIDKSIETIFDYQWSKGPKTTRTYMSEARNTRDREHDVTSFAETSQQDLAVTEVSIHPRHKKQMKPHQLDGFDFLVRNLVADEPGGCILAHAPGSGKTFMIISFLQSFLAKYPNARPLIVLPKGILATWKREFPRWQIEDFPLYDFYTTKAEKRSDQLEILKQWMEHKGILFLGYKQFSNIVCSSENNKTAAACHDLLLSVPTILILDEGHTPRNEDTNVVNALAQVKTPRKVVLSGTLFQNHVKEVFNILNLVRPKFLKLDTSKAIKRRIMSRVQISGGRRQLKTNGGDPLFYDLVEETLQHDEDFKRKVTVIRDLREMTKNVLHYYKGDFLDELPGILDLTVFLNLSPKQKYHVEKLKKMEKFKKHSIGTAVYIHPLLKEFSETALVRDKGCHFDEDKMENLLNKMDIRDGVKAKFFLNILALCESSGEKVLVFSQYLLPLKFLEKLVVKTKGWSVGKEIFIISGDTSPEQRELSMERFNNTSEAKVFFGSIKACGEGISLVGASRVLLLDVHLNPSVSRQAIGRAFRPGQERKVYIYRLVAAESPEEENHNTCFRKELISKMWFEWSEYSGHKDFEMETVDSKDTDDMFWESPLLGEDVKVLYKR